MRETSGLNRNDGDETTEKQKQPRFMILIM